MNQLWNAITGSGLANLCDCYVVAVEEGVGGGGGGIFTNKVLEDMDKGLVWYTLTSNFGPERKIYIEFEL